MVFGIVLLIILRIFCDVVCVVILGVFFVNDVMYFCIWVLKFGGNCLLRMCFNLFFFFGVNVEKVFV